MKRLFQGGQTVSGKDVIKQDILVNGDRIEAIGLDLDAHDAEVIDVTGKLLFPGFIDPHTHFDLEVSNTVTADDYETGSLAAIAGGTTLVIDFATQNRGETLHKALDNWNKKANDKSYCDYAFHMAISEWNEEIAGEVDDMIKQGITSFKLYMTYDAMYLNDGDIYRALCKMKEVGGLVGVHCENRELIDALVEEEKEAGHLSPDSHPRTRPKQAEAEAIDRLLEIASLVDVPVMIVHLSTARGLEVIKNARKRGQSVFVETCPQYLLLDESKYELRDFESAKYVISPPLRTRNDNEILWSALGNGDISTIGTDHCSFTLKQKEAGLDDFTKIPCGMPGVENRAALIYTYGVKAGKISENEMCSLLSENAAKLYGLYPRKGTLQPGSDADIVVWDKDAVRTLDANQQSACDYNPFEGTKVYGIAERVYLRGELAAKNEIPIKTYKGKYISRERGI
ncbi:MAG: dihydropyrimidinase [Suipraeoptans sp.]